MATQRQTIVIQIPLQSIRLRVGAGAAIKRPLLVAGILFFLLAVNLHADIFVSNYNGGSSGTVERFDDTGHRIGNAPFISGLGGTEGVSCVKKSTNEFYVADNGGVVHVYNLTTGGSLRNMAIAGATRIAAMSFSIDGSILYLADYAGGHIFGVNPSNGNVIYTASPGIYGPVHDVRVGPDGFVYATYFSRHTGVFRYSMDLSTRTQFVANGDHGLTSAGGMAFDASGNLWVSNFASNGFVSVYQNTAGVSTYLFTISGIGAGLGIDLGPDHNIYIADFNGNKVNKIDVVGGTYAVTTIIDMYLSYPKYVNFSENCCDTGYIEICKQSDPAHPVTGTYTFTATASFFTGSPVQVPVGQCSGVQQVPSGAVTLTEAAVLGIAVDDVTAYSYNDLGYYVDQLNTWLRPQLHATVNVAAGDVDLETIATFTNYAAPPGQLKVCKIAGPGVQVGTPFNFQINAPGHLPVMVTIPAGPANQGGYCQVIGTYQVNTPVLVTELLGPNSPYQVSNITVQPADRGSHYMQTSVIVTIGAGVTEASFTNVPKSGMPFYNNFGTGGSLYQCSPLGWNVAGSTSPVGFYTQAAEFTSQTTGSVSEIDVGVNWVSGPNQFFLALYTESGGLPGTQIAQWATGNDGRCPQPVSITGITGVTLTAGTNYFLVVGPTIQASSIYFRWNLNNQGAMGTHLYATSGCQNGSGNGCNWTSAGTQTLAAFDIH